MVFGGIIKIISRDKVQIYVSHTNIQSFWNMHEICRVDSSIIASKMTFSGIPEASTSAEFNPIITSPARNLNNL